MPKFDSKQWDELLENLKRRHAPICRQWFFEELSPGTLGGGLLEIHTSTTVQQNYLQNRCLEPFTEAAQETTGQLVAVRFVCETHATPSEPSVAQLDTQAQTNPGDSAIGLTLPAPGPKPPTPPTFYPPSDDAADIEAESMVLSPDYTFDNFITGPNNQLAYAASVAVANQPGTAYNPLFIHGGVGLGKTHLLQAICQSVLNANPQTRILFVSCDAFMNQFIRCVSAGKMDSFRHRYRHVDLLVIDDIHFLAQRERSQEEFFHTFNELYQSNKQIVLSSDAPPQDIPDLEERLLSRFQWGMVAPVYKPSFETRVAILKAKAQIRGLKVPAEVIDFIAKRIDTNARELEGAIINVQGRSNLLDRPIDLNVAYEALGEPEQAPRANHATLQQIIDTVTEYFNIKVSDLQSRRRHKSVTEPRQLCMWLARKRTRFSLEEIGGHFGGRDHTTVMHSVKIVDERLSTDDLFASQVEQIKRQLDRINTPG